MNFKNTQIVNLNLIYQFAGEDKEIVNELVEVFLRQTPMILELLQTSMGEKNWEEVAKSVHKLKPSLGTMGMNVERDLAIDIEKNCKELNTEHIKNKVDILVKRCLLAIDELKQVND